MLNFARPFRIFCGSEITNYVSAVLQRDKTQMTGQLQFGLFYDGVPGSPISSLAAVRAGAPIQVYVGNRLAFTGTVDNRGAGNSKKMKENVNRLGKGQHSSIGQGKMSKGGGVSTHIGPNEYVITVRARGMTKRLVGSSHYIEESCLPNATCRSAISKLVERFGVPIDWRAGDYDLDVATFRDGGLVYQEIDRITTENGLYAYETRDGKLRISDQALGDMGEALILGDNILEFETDQGEDDANQEVVVKGRRRKKGVRGQDAVMRKVKLRDSWVPSESRLTIQGYGDGTDDALERRGKFELDRRAQMVKNCRIQTFGVLQRDGSPWDIGLLHHVRIPSEGIDGVFECISLTYTVNNDKTCHTTLTLAPPPSAGVAGGIGSFGGLGGLAIGGAVAGARATSRSRASGKYPLPWGSPEIRNATAETPEDVATVAVGAPPPAPLPDKIDEPNQ